MLAAVGEAKVVLGVKDTNHATSKRKGGVQSLPLSYKSIAIFTC